MALVAALNGRKTGFDQSVGIRREISGTAIRGLSCVTTTPLAELVNADQDGFLVEFVLDPHILFINYLTSCNIIVDKM